MTDRDCCILLNSVPGLGTPSLRRLLEGLGSYAAVFKASEKELTQAGGIRNSLAQKIIKAARNPGIVEDELKSCARLGCEIVTREDEAYPLMLRLIVDPPLALYIKGKWQVPPGCAIAVVGSRGASFYGKEMAGRLSYDLALRGVTIVSGLARGIDAASHAGALKASGKTLAVLGSGLGCLYPPEHEALAERIAESGAVLSEYPMMTQPVPYNFPRRNRIISGLSLGVVVVEASAKSGALITADCALEQGREVFAVPGPANSVTSQGTHRLLKQGARLVTSVEDIIEELGLTVETAARPSEKPQKAAAGYFSDEEKRMLALISDEPCAIDSLIEKSGKEPSQAASLLVKLELKGKIRQLPGKYFVQNTSGR